MTNIISRFIACFFMLPTAANAQSQASSNLSSQASLTPVTSSVYGVFNGRTPCQEIARELNLKVRTVCNKRKLGLVLYQDSITHKPTTYKITGMGEKSGEGNWHIVKGTATDTGAIVFKLDMGDAFLFLLKGDENVLFILDKHKNFLPGNAHHSYTLNRRIKEKIPWPEELDLKNKGY